jgi:hypothetical protein
MLARHSRGNAGYKGPLDLTNTITLHVCKIPLPCRIGIPFRYRFCMVI